MIFLFLLFNSIHLLANILVVNLVGICDDLGTIHFCLLSSLKILFDTKVLIVNSLSLGDVPVPSISLLLLTLPVDSHSNWVSEEKQNVPSKLSTILAVYF